MAKLSTKARNKLPASSFALPGERKYPVNDPPHARNAKARASMMANEGRISRSTEAKIDAAADRKLHRGHHRTSSGRHSFHNLKHSGHKDKMY